MDYIELNIKLQPLKPFNEIIVAQLADAGFESFVNTDEGVLAYGQVQETSVERALKETFLGEEREDVSFSFESQIIEHQNWNAVWESDFEPVYVEELASILAPFHDKSIAKGIIVEIQPKMSFGTGHHQTTWMMSKALFDLHPFPKKVLDMGTGTGVLAILAEKLGATAILAIDIEDWSAENTVENAERNQCKHIETKCGDVDLISGTKFDTILANINKNVLKAHIPFYAQSLNDGGVLLLSGFFDSDTDELIEFARAFGFEKEHIYNKDNWAAIKLIYKSRD
ncbi:MAG: 50S ribosomal protein L11 methyltransferase [Crocinitomicaceae bacterium]|nr:50S ribosomal protein L11 methyltransferase [Crocinitomicaceae bacterium]